MDGPDRQSDAGGSTPGERFAARTPAYWAITASAFVLLVSVVVLRAMGREWWCRGGELFPFSWDVWSMHNSQHVADPYTFSHVLHGLLFYALLSLLLGKRLGVWSRLPIALVIEAAWEIFENTEFVINRYRESTISLDYFGDSVINSTADIASCALGYGIAAAIPVWFSFACFAATEIVMLIWIRDSLLINVLMLVRPIEAIKNWQMGG